MHKDKLENIPVGYVYDDLLIQPKASSVDSRQHVNLSTELFPGIIFSTPIIAAPMSTISESAMCIKMYELGGLGILHRFAALSYLQSEMAKIRDVVPQEYCAFAIGVKDIDKTILSALSPMAGIVCIDLNLGHHTRVVDQIHFIKKRYPHLRIIAGNVSTSDGAYSLCHAGADCIRATNGNGTVCQTLSVTGVGIPVATSLHACWHGTQAAQETTGQMKTLIADGGITSSGKAAIAIGLGADAVMLGNLLAASSACPQSAFFVENGEYRALYSGMASEEAQIARFGKMMANTAPEGRTISMPLKGKTANIVNELAAGLRSSFSFVNALNIQEFKENSEFILAR